MVNKKILFFIVFLLIIPFILSECEEDQIDINTASAEELDQIIWVGSATAENIINERPFDSVDDLIRVYGIGEIKLQDIKEQGLACVANNQENNEVDSNQLNSDDNSNEDEEDEDDSEPEIIYVSQKNPPEIKNKVLNTINLNTEENNQGLTKNDYALYSLIIFAVIIIVLFLLKKNKFKNEFG